MKTVITSGLTDERKRQVTQEFIGSPAFRECLIAVLNGKKASFRSIVTSKDSYSIPNWAYLQADAIGYERAIDEVISLLMSKKGEI